MDPIGAPRPTRQGPCGRPGRRHNRATQTRGGGRHSRHEAAVAGEGFAGEGGGPIVGQSVGVQQDRSPVANGGFLVSSGAGGAHRSTVGSKPRVRLGPNLRRWQSSTMASCRRDGLGCQVGLGEDDGLLLQPRVIIENEPACTANHHEQRSDREVGKRHGAEERVRVRARHPGRIRGR